MAFEEIAKMMLNCNNPVNKVYVTKLHNALMRFVVDYDPYYSTGDMASATEFIQMIIDSYLLSNFDICGLLKRENIPHSFVEKQLLTCESCGYMVSAQSRSQSFCRAM